MSKEDDGELDPRIQIELENLNTATDQINKLEIELEEANSTFRILLNESTRRLKLSSKKLGNCIEKARPYHEALEKAREAQIECQRVAVKFQRANEIHAAAKETVALAEQRFMSNSHEWQFDNAWQEMLNHATQKVMDAEKQKAESHAEHQLKARLFNAAEMKVQQLEERFRRSIAKSRPYFEEKQICQDQLQTQKNRIQELQAQVQNAKQTYSTALRNLERISDEIHRQRGDFVAMTTPPPGPREPGVGAELASLPDFNLELERCDLPSMGGSEMSLTTTTSSSVRSERGGDGGADMETDNEDEQQQQIDEDLVEELRKKVKTLAVRPVEGGDGQQEQDVWESELNATVDKLDHLMMMKECAAMSSTKLNEKPFAQQRPQSVLGAEAKGPLIKISPTAVSDILSDDAVSSLPVTPQKHSAAIKKLKALEPLPSVNVSMRELPLLARLDTRAGGYSKQRRRSLD
ncbi:SH3 domain-binding protein 5 homolog [Episyrphus balteatus]|uniref:SH3 domain-binding protein 5 homolog n=1 Tax=Episyrphus balteatus TaxID=286459 RepID=UPI002485FC7D|nr:SH3 domain-binding protein 5 homolog [Episyrphus balteatus]